MQQSGDNKLLNRNQSGKCMPLRLSMITRYIIRVDRMLQDMGAVQPNLNELKSRTSTAHIKTRKMIWLVRISKVTKSIAILLGIGSLILTSDNNQPVSYASDVHPGLDKATLRLFKGTKIKSSDTKCKLLLNRLSIEIGKAADSILVHKVASNSNTSENNCTTTPNRGKYKKVLSYGTRGWLKAASSLPFNTSLKLDTGGEKVGNV